VSRETVLQIFTNAPQSLDFYGTLKFGELGSLRIVSIEGDNLIAEAQVLRYRDRGFFATQQRLEAVKFVTAEQTLE
jgi:hypothetical protein